MPSVAKLSKIVKILIDAAESEGVSVMDIEQIVGKKDVSKVPGLIMESDVLMRFFKINKIKASNGNELPLYRFEGLNHSDIPNVVEIIR